MSETNPAPNPQNKTAREETFSKRRHRLVLLNTFLMSMAVIMIMAECNFLGFRHSTRFHTTERFKISERTENMLRTLEDNILIYCIYKRGDDLSGMVQDQLKEFEPYTNRIQVVLVDPYEERIKFQRLVKDFNYPQLGRDTIVARLDKEGKPDRSRILKPTDLLDRMTNAPKIEEALYMAVRTVTAKKSIKVYFSTGHGEMDIYDSSDVTRGLGHMVGPMNSEAYEVDKVNLIQSDRVPEDCDLLVIADVKDSWGIREVNMLRQYLENDGRLFLMVNPYVVQMFPKGRQPVLAYGQTGLEDLLKEWGIEMLNGTIMSKGKNNPEGQGWMTFFVDKYPGNPITRIMDGRTTLFERVMAFRPVEKPDGKPGDQPDKVVEKNLTFGSFLMTSGQSFLEKEFYAEIRGQRVLLDYDSRYYQKLRDSRQAEPDFEFGVTVERRKTASDASGTRIVIIGDSDFISTSVAYKMPTNMELYMNCLHWLLGSENRIFVQEKLDQRKMKMEDKDVNLLFWVTCMMIPGVFLIGGFSVWFVRRS